MKNRVLRYWNLGWVLAMLPLAGGVTEELAGQSSEASAPSATTEAVAATNQVATATNHLGAVTNHVAAVTNTTPTLAEEPAAKDAEQANADLANAPVMAISTEKPLPANVKASEAALEVVRLANSGVDQSVLMAYVNNSKDAFKLGAEEIIYLNDMGLSGTVVTAMIQHDEVLKGGKPGAVVTLPATPEPAPIAPPTSEFASDPMPEPDPGAQYAPVPDGSAPPPMEISNGGQPDYINEGDGPPPTVATDSAFYDSLAPYGTWVNVGGYGNCWQPSAAVVDPNWQPYFNCGRWVYSDCGWYWMSGYSWGWAPFHYGRWFRHNRVGWCWSPGTVWGPSWVSWRYSSGYCGWAPLPPCAWYRPNAGLTYCGRPVSGGFGFGLTAQSYSFVKFNNFYNSHLPNYAINNRQVNTFFARTTPSTVVGFSNRRVINNGLPPSAVAAASHIPTRRVAINDVTHTDGRGGGQVERFGSRGSSLSVFRPNSPQAAGTKTSVTPRPTMPARGNSQNLAPAPRPGVPIELHGQSRTAESDKYNDTGNVNINSDKVNRTAPSRTYSREISRPTTTRNPAAANNVAANGANAGAADANGYQRWQQRVQPSQTPWYLPNSSSATARSTEKTSRNEGREMTERPQMSRTMPSVSSRPDPGVNMNNNIARQWQPSSQRNYEVPQSGYSVPQPSMTQRPDFSSPARSVAPRYDASQSRASVPTPAPSSSYSPPVSVSRAAPSQSSSSSSSQSSGGSSRPSWGSGRGGR